MSRVVAFGCSFTYGHGLRDCLGQDNHPSPVPSRFAYPQVYANKTNRKCLNCSWPGASNKHIAKRAVEFAYNENDTVLIMWTYFDRNSLFTEQKDFPIDFSAWQADDNLLSNAIEDTEESQKQSILAKAFYSHFWTEYDVAFSNLMLINSVDHIVRSQLTDGQLIHLSVPSIIDSDNADCLSAITQSEKSQNIFKWNTVTPINSFDAYHNNDKANDDWHPGQKAHSVLADTLVNYISG